MAGVSLLIKPVGGACNMDCRYCFYRDEQSHRTAQKGRMRADTLRAVFEKTLPDADGRCVITYQGGEPTLAGLAFYREAMEIERECLRPGQKVPEHCFQTNGLLLNEEWADFFRENGFLVGISLDGPRRVHDAFRTDGEGEGTFVRVTRAIRLLEEKGVPYNVLSVLTHDAAQEDLSAFFASRGIAWQQYIPCLDPLGEEPGEKEWSLRPGDYGAFLIRRFDFWLERLEGGTPVFDRFFDNLLRILLGTTPEACDMRGMCGDQLVVEANGDVYPCDFYCIDAYLLGNFTRDTREQIEKKRQALGFVQASRLRDAECAACEWFFLCRGGCRRHRSPKPDNACAAGRNRFCTDYKAFFSHAAPTLARIAQRLKNRSG